MSNFIYTIIGALFGVVLYKGEVVSWFRIQEMFRFQGFHMYGVIMSAVVVGALFVVILKKSQAKTVGGKPITIKRKPLTHGTWLGGVIFGMGWALTGACPGPLYALVGSGVSVMIVAMVAAMVGVWLYAALRPKLPH